MNKTAKNLAHSVSLWLAIVVAFPLFFASCKDTDDKDDDAVPLDDAVLIDEDVDAPPVGDELKVMIDGYTTLSRASPYTRIYSMHG